VAGITAFDFSFIMNMNYLRRESFPCKSHIHGMQCSGNVILLYKHSCFTISKFLFVCWILNGVYLFILGGILYIGQENIWACIKRYRVNVTISSSQYMPSHANLFSLLAFSGLLTLDTATVCDLGKEKFIDLFPVY
jgi:hypothetical protein